jgi:hypothetical protein
MEVSYQNSGRKMANFGDLDETFVPKSANLGGVWCFQVLNFLRATVGGAGSSKFWDREITIHFGPQNPNFRGVTV